jgi:hypothetical protein
MKRYGFALIAVAMSLVMLPGAALASTFTVDQSNTGTDNFDQSTTPKYAQTFTAGRYGPLEYVELYLGNATSVNVAVALYSTTGTAATAVPHAIIDFTRKTVTTGPGEWVQFSFGNDILLSGHVYAIVIAATPDAALFGTSANAYSRGRALALVGSTWKTEASVAYLGPADWAFKTEMGAAAATPTPTRAPTRAPATPAPTATPTAAPAATPTAIPSATAATIATASASATAAPAGSAAPGSGSSAPGSDSSGSGDSTLPLIAAIVLALILAGGGMGLLLMRKRRAAA